MAAVALLLLTACRATPPPPLPSVTDTAERGPFKLTATVAPADVWYGDAVTLDLRLQTPDDILVRFPAANAFGDLEVSAGPAADARPAAAGGLEWQQSYTVTALHPGVLEIPPAVVTYAKKPTDAAVEPQYQQELATGTLKVNVRSALTTQDSVQSPRDITGARALPERADPWRTAARIAGSLAGLAAAYFAYRFVRWRLTRPAPPIAPEVWALRALQELNAADWIAASRAREHYYRLSEIVRSYIERKFGLSAPEMTTEEFLHTLAQDRGALPYSPDRLRDFLTACDIVKYAGYSPSREAAADTLGAARAFIDATAAAAAHATESHSRFHRPTGGMAA